MKFTRRFLGAITTAAVAMTAANAVLAEGFPEKPIELIVPYAPGGLSDTVGRSLAKAAEKTLGQPIAVINKPGGGGTIGITAGLTSKPDGYTIVFTTSSPISLQPLHGKTPYQPDDFQGIAKVYDIPSSMNVHLDSDVDNFDDWVAWVKEHPGEFTYGTAGGTGSGGHIASVQLAESLGLDIKHVPYEGQATLAGAVAGKQIMGSNTTPDVHVGGVMNPMIFVTKAKPADPLYDSVPTTIDKEIDAVVSFFSGVIGHKDIPADRVKILQDAFKTALDDEAVKKTFENYKFAIDYADSAEFTDIISNTAASNQKTMKALGLID